MKHPLVRAVLSLLVLCVAALVVTGRLTAGARGGSKAVLPEPVDGAMLAAAPALDTAVFAGGCFWGIEGVYEHVKGVQSAVSGYAGGSVASPSYEQVSSGDTGHAESVEVIFDPSQVSYGQLLQIFFSVAHDPTERNRQGPDVGTQYRSAVFYRNDAQKRATESYIAQLADAKAFPRPIVTEVAPLRAFFPAEDYHQGYMMRHPNAPYIVINDAPKVKHLRQAFPALYREPTGA